MKGGDFMKNNFLSTLFVGIDVSSKTNVLCALDFEGNKLLDLKALNNQLWCRINSRKHSWLFEILVARTMLLLP